MVKPYRDLVEQTSIFEMIPTFYKEILSPLEGNMKCSFSTIHSIGGPRLYVSIVTNDSKANSIIMAKAGEKWIIISNPPPSKCIFDLSEQLSAAAIEYLGDT